MNAFEYQAALEIVKEFYANVWEDLKWILGIAFTVVTVVPIVTTIIQRIPDKTIRSMKKKLETLQRDVSLSIGMSYFNQGNMLLREFENSRADETLKLDNCIISFFKSLESFIHINDERRFCIVIDTLLTRQYEITYS